VMDREKVIESLYEQTFAEITLAGELHEGFGAGPILAFFGASHREDQVNQYVPELDDEFVFLGGQNTGFRGLVPENFPGGMAGVRAGSVPSGFIGTSNLSRILFTGSIQTPTTVLDGSFTVDEAFTEINVPLLSDMALVQQLDASVAYRYADYSGSGGIDSWKVGLSWQINDELRLRATKSRDVRAASLRERFDETAGGAAVTDPFNGNNFIFTASRSAGNPNVDPEEADTLTFGAVYQPAWLDGFSVSGDAYSITIDGALAQPGFQDIVDGCFDGGQVFCDLIERGSDNLITRITSIYFNLDELRLKGFDLEMRYTTEVSLLGGDETLSWRLIAASVDENSQLVAGAPRDYLDRQQPSLRYLTNLTYTRGDFRAFLNGRYTDEYSLNRRFVEGVDVDDNTVDSVFYTDMTLGYDFAGENGSNFNVFLSINNLFDEEPPQTPGNGVAFLGGTNGVNGLYDALGRRYVMGVNMSF
jgi:iron complex outermembrane recepter protein